MSDLLYICAQIPATFASCRMLCADWLAGVRTKLRVMPWFPSAPYSCTDPNPNFQELIMKLAPAYMPPETAVSSKFLRSYRSEDQARETEPDYRPLLFTPKTNSFRQARRTPVAKDSSPGKQSRAG